MLMRRREVAEEYGRQLTGIEGLQLPSYDAPNAEISWFVYVVRLKGFDRASRDRVLDNLRSQGIACSDYFSPLHLQPHFRQRGFSEGDFPITEAVSASTVALPFYNTLRKNQIRRISDTLRSALGHEPQAAHPLHRSIL